MKICNPPLSPFRKGGLTKICLFTLLICLMSSSGFAISLPVSIAIEFQENGTFTGIIGKAYITEKAVEVVTFARQNGEVVPFAFIYTILEIEDKADGIYNIKCRNQLGTISVGTIDISDILNPKITLTSASPTKGISLTNISDAGRKLKKEYIPKVDLGR